MSESENCSHNCRECEGYQCAVLDADITEPSIPRMFGIHEKTVSNGNGILPAETKNGMKIMSINVLDWLLEK